MAYVIKSPMDQYLRSWWITGVTCWTPKQRRAARFDSLEQVCIIRDSVCEKGDRIVRLRGNGEVRS